MIAGPATIAAALPMAVSHGFGISFTAVAIAVSVNMVFMLLARPIVNILVRFNIMGALIRITGLIVATIGVQMILSGITKWLLSIKTV
jgi:multiple antibiotic resistance protein